MKGVKIIGALLQKVRVAGCECRIGALLKSLPGTGLHFQDFLKLKNTKDVVQLKSQSATFNLVL